MYTASWHDWTTGSVLYNQATSFNEYDNHLRRNIDRTDIYKKIQISTSRTHTNGTGMMYSQYTTLADEAVNVYSVDKVFEKCI